MNWTPGPWLVGKRNGWVKPSVFTQEGRYMIVTAVCGGGQGAGDAVAANAHLIAAAPDLYEALQACVEAMSKWQDNAWEEYAAATEQAHAALSKARGEAMPKKERSA